MRATWSQVSRVELAQALALGAEHQRERRAQRQSGEVVPRRSLSRPITRKPRCLQRGQPARQVLHVDQRHVLERAGGGLGQHAGRLRAVARRGDDAVGGEGGGRAEDGADIVRIGDLVEHQHDAVAGKSSTAGEGSGSASR